MDFGMGPLWFPRSPCSSLTSPMISWRLLIKSHSSQVYPHAQAVAPLGGLWLLPMTLDTYDPSFPRKTSMYGFQPWRSRSNSSHACRISQSFAVLSTPISWGSLGGSTDCPGLWRIWWRARHCGRAWISLPVVELCHDPVDCQANFKIKQVNLGSPPRTFGSDMQNRILRKVISERTLGAVTECTTVFLQGACGNAAEFATRQEEQSSSLSHNVGSYVDTFFLGQGSGQRVGRTKVSINLSYHSMSQVTPTF